MGKDRKEKPGEQKIVVKYDQLTGKCSVDCTGIKSRSVAHKVLQKGIRQIRLSWGGTEGLTGLGITKSTRKEENIKIAEEHRKKVAERRVNKLKQIAQYNAIFDGTTEKLDKIRYAVTRVKEKVNANDNDNDNDNDNNQNEKEIA